MIAETDIFFPKHQRLGEILLKRKVVERKHLARALKIQKKENVRIGEILTNMGVAGERDIVAALVVQCCFPYIAIDKYNINQEIINIISKDFALKHRVIPLDLVGNVLSLVTSNPLNETTVKELKEITRCKIVWFISTKIEIDKAIKCWYSF